MNIFEVLNLPANHREKDKVTMKVRHFDEVPDSKKPRRAVYYAQIKKDGIFCHVVKRSGQYGLFSRTGMELVNTDTCIRRLELWGEKMEDGVYMTELCCDECSLEALSGIFNPNRVKPLDEDQEEWKRDSHLYFHDYITLADFATGISKVDYSARYHYLQGMLPKEFCLLDTALIHIDDISELAKYHIAMGEEGIVVKRACEKWEAGHKGYKQMKIVRGVDYDLECIGVEEGTGKYKGKVANLIFRWKNGKQVKAMLGKGWTHDQAAEMWVSYNSQDMPSYNLIGQIFHVHALQESSKGVLRLPKVMEMRMDKEVADV